MTPSPQLYGTSPAISQRSYSLVLFPLALPLREVKDNCFCEVMTHVLLERFIVHRPHPWGALVMFIELLRNQKYEFWSKEFVRVAHEVTMLLEIVSALVSYSIHGS